MKYKLILLLIITLLFPSYTFSANWNTYDNLTAGDLETDDEFGVWDTSASGFKNLPMSEMYIFLFTRQYEKLTTGSDTLTAADNGKTFTNAGAIANVTWTAPECTSTTEGWNAKFVQVDTSFNIIVDVHANDQLNGITNATGDSMISPGTLGSAAYIECFDLGSSVYDWIVYDDGLWTDND